jgi:septal ring-binding cell division protein DamX/ABC-type transporter Mla subunit MlaD
MGKKAKKTEKIRSRLDQLAGQNSVLNAKQKEIRKQWKALRRKYKTLVGRYEAIDERVTSLQTHTSELGSESLQIKKYLAQKNKTTKKIRRRLNRLESGQKNHLEQINVLNQQLARHSRLIDGINGRLASVEELAQQGELLGEQIEYLHASKAEFDAQIGQLISRIIELKSSHDDLGSDIGNLSSTLDELLARVEDSLQGHQAMQTRLETLELADSDRLQQLEKQHEQIAGMSRTLEEVKEYFSTRDEELENKLQHLDADYHRLVVEGLDQHRVQIQGLFDRTEVFDQTAQTSADVAQTLQDQLVELRGNLAKAEERLYGRNTELEKKIQHLDSAYGQLSEDSKAQQRQMMDAWVESLNQVEASLSQQADFQTGQIDTLAERTGKLDKAVESSVDTNLSLQKQVAGFRKVLITAVKRLATNDAGLEKNTRHLNLEYQHLARRHERLSKGVFGAGILLLILGGIGFWTLLNRMPQETVVASNHIEPMTEVREQQSRIPAEKQRPALMSIDAQSDSALRIEQLEQTQEDMEQQLQKIHGRLSELVAEQTEWQAVVTQQGEALRLIKERLSEKGGAELAASVKAQDSQNSLRNSGWLEKLNPRHYTLQILAAHDEVSVARVAARKDLQDVVAIYKKTSLSQQDWYILLYGDFPSFRTARAAVADLPDDIRENSPWIRSLSDVQNDLVD